MYLALFNQGIFLMNNEHIVNLSWKIIFVWWLKRHLVDKNFHVVCLAFSIGFATGKDPGIESDTLDVLNIMGEPHARSVTHVIRQDMSNLALLPRPDAEVNVTQLNIFLSHSGHLISADKHQILETGLSSLCRKRKNI